MKPGSVSYMVLDCIAKGITDRDLIAETCGITRNQVQYKFQYLVTRGLIEVDTKSQQAGRGKGSLPGTYRVVGAKPVYRNPWSFATSVFHLGANA
jgi:hypothetical protein